MISSSNFCVIFLLRVLDKQIRVLIHRRTRHHADGLAVQIPDAGNRARCFLRKTAKRRAQQKKRAKRRQSPNHVLFHAVPSFLYFTPPVRRSARPISKSRDPVPAPQRCGHKSLRRPWKRSNRARPRCGPGGAPHRRSICRAEGNRMCRGNLVCYRNFPPWFFSSLSILLFASGANSRTPR